MRLKNTLAILTITLLSLGGCTESTTPDDAGGTDTRGVDSGGVDSGGVDSGGVDSGGVDTGTDGGVACAPVVCDPATCRTYFVDGCAQCYCPPPSECVDNGDCVLANLTGICCPGCTQAYPRTVADANQCIVEIYTPSDPSCMGVGCEAIDCPAIACAAPARAICNMGSCEAASDCLPGDVMTRFGCAPGCTLDEECTIATNTSQCCTDCEVVMHTSLKDSLSCFFGREETAGADCLPDAEGCREIACPDIACLEISAAVCNVGTGLCEAAGPGM